MGVIYAYIKFVAETDDECMDDLVIRIAPRFRYVLSRVRRRMAKFSCHHDLLNLDLVLFCSIPWCFDHDGIHSGSIMQKVDVVA